MPACCRRHWPDARDARSLEVSGVKSILRANGGAAFGQFALAFFIGMVSAGATADAVGLAAARFRRAVAAARNELVPHRRCENALRDMQPERALQFAREAVAAYPAGVLAHVCLTWALRATGAPSADVLTAARE